MTPFEVCSSVIALCAAGFTFYQAHLSRKHNRLSVMPHLQRANTYGWKSGGGQFGYSIYLQNYALGPARICSVKILLDGKLIGPGIEEIQSCIANASKSNGIMIEESTISIPTKNYVVKAHGEYRFCEFVMWLQSDKEDAFKFLSRFNAIIEYESFYGDKATLKI